MHIGMILQIDFDISDDWAVPIIYSSNDDWSSNLKTILEWSPFTSKDDLLQQVTWKRTHLFYYALFVSLVI